MIVCIIPPAKGAAAQTASCELYKITFYSSEAFPGRTASGIGTIGNEWSLVAVDPRVIPLGSYIYIDDWGMFLAADTGGGVRGRHVDVLVYTQAEAFNLGVQYRTVCV